MITKKTILITGGTSGIGLALVKKLCAHNTILVLARSAKKLEELFFAEQNIACYPCDLTSPAHITECVKNITHDYPEISVLINNAGIQFTPRFTEKEFRLESINEEIQVNLQAPLLLSALLIKHWQSQNRECSIVNISSALAIFPKTSAAVYCATKSALHNFSVSLGYQLEDTSIRVHEAILPLVNTPMTNGRSGKKISADTAAQEIIIGMCKRKKFIYVGKTKWIPLLARISPAFIAKVLKKY